MKTKKSNTKIDEIELASDAWERFERAVDVVIKSGPKHRKSGERKLGIEKITARRRPKKGRNPVSTDPSGAVRAD